MLGTFYDKIYLATILLTVITGVYGIIKLRGLHISSIDYHMSEEQSDGLVMGVFHLVLSAVCVYCLI